MKYEDARLVDIEKAFEFKKIAKNAQFVIGSVEGGVTFNASTFDVAKKIINQYANIGHTPYVMVEIIGADANGKESKSTMPVLGPLYEVPEVPKRTLWEKFVAFFS